MTQDEIIIIAVGGGGTRVIDRVAEVLPAGPVVVAVDTDVDSLEQSRAAVKVQIGGRQVKGRGTAGDSDVAAAAAREESARLAELCAGKKLAFVVTALGGGVGTGAAPVVLKTAREAGAFTIGMATLPFEFEGPARNQHARRSVSRLRRDCDVPIVVPNVRLLSDAVSPHVAEAFERADRELGACMVYLWKLLTSPAYIRIGLADLQKVARADGLVTMASGNGTGRTKAQKAVTALLEGPLTEQGRIVADAKSLLVSIVGGFDLTLDEVGTIMDAISARMGDDSELTVGTSVDPDWRGRVTVTVLASESVGDPEGDKAPTEESSAATPGRRPRRTRKADALQAELNLEVSRRGRFKNIEPTILDGEDLDTPTFLRRGIQIEK